MAGGPSESIWQPEWSPDGVLHFVSDRDGWWNLYRDGEQLTARAGRARLPAVGLRRVDLRLPGERRHRLRARATAATSVSASCARWGRRSSRISAFPTPPWATPRSGAGAIAWCYVALRPAAEEAVVTWEPREGARVVSDAGEDTLDPAWAPEPRAIEFPSAGGRTAHAFWYPPTNPDYEAPEGELPAADRADPRRPDGARDTDARSRDRLLDEPRVRRRRRELRRQHRLRARVPRGC